MIHSLHALILRNGNSVRHAARSSTVARYLRDVEHLADYSVVYWLAGAPHRMTGEGFLTLYAAGRIPEPQRFGRHEGVTCLTTPPTLTSTKCPTTSP
jgi:hypothetical protein